MNNVYQDHDFNKLGRIYHPLISQFTIFVSLSIDVVLSISLFDFVGLRWFFSTSSVDVWLLNFHAYRLCFNKQFFKKMTVCIHCLAVNQFHRCVFELVY